VRVVLIPPKLKKRRAGSAESLAGFHVTASCQRERRGGNEGRENTRGREGEELRRVGTTEYLVWYPFTVT